MSGVSQEAAQRAAAQQRDQQAAAARAEANRQHQQAADYLSQRRSGLLGWLVNWWYEWQASRAEARADQALADAIRLEAEAAALHAGADAAQQQADRRANEALALSEQADQLLTGIGEQQTALQALESAIADLLAEAAHHQHLADNPPQREQIRHFIYGLQGQLLGEYREDGTPLREYLHADGAPLMMVRYTPDEAALYWYHTDHLGTPQALTDRHGQIAWQAQYDPFGEVVLLVNNVTQPLRFPGQYFDEETGLHYNYFRDYDPGTGRYVQSDPIGLMKDYSDPRLSIHRHFSGLGVSRVLLYPNHLYLYALASPLSYYDFYALDVSICIAAGEKTCELGRRRCRQLLGMAALNTATGFACDIGCDTCKKNVKDWCEENPDAKEPPLSETEVKPDYDALP